MPEHKLVQVYYEGDDDRAVLQGLLGAGLLPTGLKIADRDRNHPGKDGIIDDYIPFVRPANGVGGTAVVLMDLDELKPEELEAQLRKQVLAKLQGSVPKITLNEERSQSGRVMVLTLSAGAHTGRVALVRVGLNEDAAFLARYGCTKFAVDDHVLRLACEEPVYSAVSEMGSVPHELAMRKLDEVAELLRRNGLVLQQSKRFLHILHAVTAFRASPATFIQRLMENASTAAGPGALRTIFHPLVDDLEEAALHLLI